MGWDLADLACLVINMYQAPGARACSWLGGGGRCCRRIWKPFPNEDAVRAACHLGLGSLGERDDSWTVGQTWGSLGDMGILQEPDLPMHPRNVGEEESSQKRPKLRETWQPPPWTVFPQRIFESCALHMPRPPDCALTLVVLPTQPSQNCAVSRHLLLPA